MSNKTTQRREFIRQSTLLGMFSAFGIDAAVAQSGPTIRIVVGFPPGGPSDTVARLLAEGMRSRLNRSVVVENRPGAASRLARAEVKRAMPDGNTLIFSPVGATSVLPHLYTAKNLGYKSEDFMPVARVANYEYVLTVGPHVKASSIRELREWLINNPTLATCANPGTGTIPDLLSRVLADSLKLPITSVAYKGTTPALQDLMGGHVSLSIDTPSDVVELYKSGKVKVMAYISDKRSPLMPLVPTLTEQGYPLSADSFHGVWAPVGVPADVINRLNSVIVSVLSDAVVKEQLAKLGLTTAPSTPNELAKAEQEDILRWADFIKRTGLTMTD